MTRVLSVVVSCLCLLAHFTSSASAANVTLTVDTTSTPRQVSNNLWGAFFEELNHAGEGGVYSQQILNTAFESKTTEPWVPYIEAGVDGTVLVTTDTPLTIQSPHAMVVSTTGSGPATVVRVSNPGFWGISLVNQSSFLLDLFVFSSTIKSVRAQLHNADYSTVYAETTVSGVGSNWTHLNATLTLNSPSTDTHAWFSLVWDIEGQSDTITFDVITLFPSEGWRGLSFIRRDLGDMVAAIHPSVLRVPGGSYVDGVNIAGRFEWNNTLYGHEHRPGHANLWGYWGEDGLGIYELLSWAEKMTDPYGQPTRAVWVVNAGISYSGEVIKPEQLDAWVQDAINAVQFANGGVDTPYGAIRAQMGHPASFDLQYMSIGNENCQGAGSSTYPKYYPAFYKKIKATYPELNLLSNCNWTTLGAFDLYDWHTYLSPDQMKDGYHEFDNYNTSQQIFVSEYASRGGTAGNGTLEAALGEATFANGMEVNSHVVKMSSYAPLFANANSREWTPDAIYFTSSDAYGTPSYWTQVMYGNSFEGLSGPPKTVKFDGVGRDTRRFSASVTVGSLSAEYAATKNAASTAYILKLVNSDAESSTVTVDMQGLPSGTTFTAPADLFWLTSADREDLNSFDNPMKVSPQYTTVNIKSAKFDLPLPAFTIAVLRVYLSTSSSASRIMTE